MFKIGDKIVCMDNGMASLLVLHKTYEIYWYDEKTKMVRIIDNFNRLGDYSDMRFILLTEYRKQKLEKICSKLAM